MAPGWSTLVTAEQTLATEELIIMIAASMLKTTRWKRRHRWWVHAILQKRHTFGLYYHLVRELQLDEEKFKEFFRLNREQFKRVLFAVEEKLVKHCRNREVLCPRERLSICLR